MKPYDKPRRGGSSTGRKESREEGSYPRHGRPGQGQRPYSSRGKPEEGQRSYPPRDRPGGPGAQERSYPPQGGPEQGQKQYSSRGRSEGGQKPYPPRAQERPYQPRGRPEEGKRQYAPRGREQEPAQYSTRERFIRRARETVQEAFKSRDMVLSGVTKAMDETHRVINVLTERFEAWYEVYLPELKLEDRKKYVEVAMVLDKDNVDFEAVAAIVGSKKAEEITAMTTKTLGAKLGERDVTEMRLLGERIISLYGLIEEYEKYQTEMAKEIAPNISEVAGPEIAAKLIAHVGSLKKLAFMPASTIQVLGAEKALFKHLRNRRIAPPKHGIIFQHPKISNSPKEVRGKIARALANKIAMAAKADAFTKNFIAPAIREDFEKRYQEIMGKSKG